MCRQSFRQLNTVQLQVAEIPTPQVNVISSFTLDHSLIYFVGLNSLPIFFYIPFNCKPLIFLLIFHYS